MYCDNTDIAQRTWKTMQIEVLTLVINKVLCPKPASKPILLTSIVKFT